jgi:hypothetical protein
MSDEHEYGANSGLFTTLIMLGNTFGILILGFMISNLSYEIFYRIFGCEKESRSL